MERFYISSLVLVSVLEILEETSSNTDFLKAEWCCVPNLRSIESDLSSKLSKPFAASQQHYSTSSENRQVAPESGQPFPVPLDTQLKPPRTHGSQTLSRPLALWRGSEELAWLLGVGAVSLPACVSMAARAKKREEWSREVGSTNHESNIFFSTAVRV